MRAVRITKRDRTRASLLVAVQEVLLESPPASLSVPRVVARIGVSQGTFYNYFDSLDAALDGVGLLLLGEHGRLVELVTDGVVDPVVVFSHSTRVTLGLAASPTGYGRLLFDSGLPVDRFLSGLRARMGADVISGLETGVFKVHEPDVVLSMVSGSILGVALDLHRGHLPRSAVEQTAERLLRDLGVVAPTAARVAHLPLDLPALRSLPISGLATVTTDQDETL